MLICVSHLNDKPSLGYGYGYADVSVTDSIPSTIILPAYIEDMPNDGCKVREVSPPYLLWYLVFVSE